MLRTSLLITAMLLASCGSASETSSETSPSAASSSSTEVVGSTPTTASSTGEPDGAFPDVIAATAELGSDGTWTFAATISSPYDTPERYADAWRVVGPDGSVFGIRELAHDHANEQPFTRSRSGIEIPAEVDRVTVQGRDLANGWGGATVEVELNR